MGTWASPGTAEKAKKLAQIMQKPIAAKDAGDVLYHLVGDDELFDDFSDIESDNSTADVRSRVADTLQDWLENLDNFFEPWEPEAIEIVQNLVTKFAVMD